jgi:hypothetical protein
MAEEREGKRKAAAKRGGEGTEAGESRMIDRMPIDNRPLTSPVAPTSVRHPAYEEDQPVERTNVLLYNGTTVNINDYNEDVHGPSVDESDDEYRMRMASMPSGRALGTLYPTTTLPNLHTFDATQAMAPIAPLPPPPMFDMLAARRAVATDDEEQEPNPRLFNPGATVRPDQTIEQRRSQLQQQMTQLDQEEQRQNEQKERKQERKQEQRKTEERKNES